MSKIDYTVMFCTIMCFCNCLCTTVCALMCGFTFITASLEKNTVDASANTTINTVSVLKQAAPDIQAESISTIEEPVEEIVEPEPTIEERLSTLSIANVYAEEAKYLAKTIWGEARGCSTTEQAAVAWCVLNRVDAEGFSNNIIKVITQPSQFHGYRRSFPVTDELYELAIDVLGRWELEKTGYTDVGRVLPKNYLYFHGDGKHNYFRSEYEGGDYWNWSLKSPYKE